VLVVETWLLLSFSRNEQARATGEQLTHAGKCQGLIELDVEEEVTDSLLYSTERFIAEVND
jgi:hypothetical protein